MCFLLLGVDRNGDGLGAGWSEGIHVREESSVFHEGLLSPLGTGSESEERPQQVVCCRVEDETGQLDLEESGERDLKLLYLLP